MARGKSRSKGGRAESINTAIRGNRGRSKRGRRGAQSGGSQHTPATTGPKEKSHRRPWDDSDDERDRPDYYSDSSDLDSDDASTTFGTKYLGVFDVEDECEDEEEEASTAAPSESSESVVATLSTTSLHSEVVPLCPWIEISADRLPKLELPEGSKDLLIQESDLFDALEVYETCRSYYRSVHISPFLFEDFCAALQSDEQSNLLAEIHISLLKLALKSDEEEQITLSVQDMNNSFNIIMQLIEPMTYAEVLRQYVESDPHRFPSDVLEALSGNYPFTGVRERLKVLSWLCDRFLQSKEYKTIVRNEGRLTSDEHCRECGKPGDVLLCDGCEACYHLECAGLADVPDGQWLCQVCTLHKVHGVTDCETSVHRYQRQPLRMTPLGYDRHGRRYWFAVRRIFVQDDGDGSVRYYSTLPQLHDVLARLDAGDLENQLHGAFMEILPSIAEQMRITMELTTQRAASIGSKMDPYLVTDNLDRLGEILTKSCDWIVEPDVVCVDTTKSVDENRAAVVLKLEESMGLNDGRLTDTFWSNGLSTEKVLSRRDQLDVGRAVASLEDGKDEMANEKVVGYRLGGCNEFRSYVNQYSVNDYAKTPYLRAKERDKKKYLCGRFSLADEGAFEWSVPKGRDIFGSATNVGLIIQQSILKMSQRIPLTLMHRLWKSDGIEAFRKALAAPYTVKMLREALLRFECGMRKLLLTNVWWGTLGHTRLTRITAEDREWKQKVDTKKKKQDRLLMVADADDEDSDIIWVKYTKIGGPPRHTLWRQKDEQYRVNGRGALGGWLWISSTLRRRFVTPAKKPPLGITSTTPASELSSLAAKKAYNLELIVNKLRVWRTEQQEAVDRVSNAAILQNCYSPSCRLGILPTALTEYGGQQCYSILCRKAQAAAGSSVSDIVHASDPLRPQKKCGSETGQDNEVLGEGKPFPLPVPFDFRVRRTGQQSLLVLPQRALKRLARQGGLNINYFAPGFHRIAKSNPHVWNYPCQRPLFDHCWRYLTLRAPSYHAVALSLRILYACVRWADMERDEEDDIHVTVHYPDHDEVRTVTGHKEWPPDGFYEQYKLRVQLIPLDDSNALGNQSGEDGDVYRPGRSSDTSRSARKRRSTSRVRLTGLNGTRNHNEIKVTEKWIDGVDLKLWEVSNYWREVEMKARRKDALMPPPSSIIVRYGSERMAAVDGTKLSPAVSRSAARRRIRPRQFADYECNDFDETYIDAEDSKAVTRENFYERPANPFRADSRARRRDVDGYDRSASAKRRRSAVCVAGGGKFALMQQGDGELRRVVLCPSDPPQVARSADTPRVINNASPIDEPPIIPRYDTAHYPNDVSLTRTRTAVTVPQRAVYTSSPVVAQSPTARATSRVLVIRRADGSTHLIRPLTQSITRDGQGAVRTIITATRAGGATMGEVRGAVNGVDTSQEAGTSGAPVQRQQQRQFINGSLSDHAGMAQPRRIISTLRGRTTFVGGQPARFVRIATPGSTGVRSQPASSNLCVRGVRGNTGTIGGNVVIDERDPFMKRMAAEKAISGTPAVCTSGPSSSARRSTGNTYAGYYGENSNDRIDVEEYQMLAEQGYRPPGRPPGRLTSSYGYGPRVRQQRPLVQGEIQTVDVNPVTQRGGRPVTSSGCRAATTTVIGTDFRPVVMYETVGQYRQSLQNQMDASRGGQSSNQGLGTQVRNVATYKDYCRKKGLELRERQRRSGDIRFDFESNEEEERAIAEAIAQEEEKMLLEEQRKTATNPTVDRNANAQHVKEENKRKELTVRRDTAAMRISGLKGRDGRQASNLDIHRGDPPEVIVCKQVLTGVIMQVCRWDNHYGWHKAILKKAGEDNSGGTYRTLKSRRAYGNQNNVDLGERIDRYKKEVNKRRVKLEARAESETGMVTPWRRPRGRPNKNGKRVFITSSPKPTNVVVPLDPSEISLGGTTTQLPQAKVDDESAESEKPVRSTFTGVDDSDEKLSMKHSPLTVSNEATEVATEVPVDHTGAVSRYPTKASSSAASLVNANMAPATSREDRKKYKRKKEASTSEDERAGLSSPNSTRQRRRPRKEGRVEPERALQSPALLPTVATPMSRSNTPHEIDPTAKHCICNKSYDPKKFYVGCDVCYRWFHGKCVGISERKSKKMSGWTCDECTKEQKKSEQELYCICQTPYDDSRFYVGCDGCEGWFHPQCVGITQADAEKAAQYLCPKCVQSTQSGYESGTSVSSSATHTLGRADYPLLWRLLEVLTEHRTSWPFREKVDPVKYPDYYKIIKKPMDLGLVQSKIEHLEYDRLKDFSADVTQIFENARTYNAKDSAIYQCADILEQRFREHLLQVKEQIEGRNRELNRVSDNQTMDNSLDIDSDQLLHTSETVDPSVLVDII
uniref:Nucleosome-remodeling factor subunit NURF301-like protein n=1 Tax=Ascaris suum TaxID=6253 RepID=F1KPU6_ASCSU